MEKQTDRFTSERFIDGKAYGILPLYHEILASRPDGFYKFQSILYRVSLYDNVSVQIAGNENSIEVTSSNKDYPVKFVKAAVEEFTRTFGISGHIRININSNIPVNSGLFEAESAAATAIKLINKSTGETVSRLNLLEYANSISNEMLCCTVSGQKYVDMLDKKKCMITSLPPLPGYSVVFLLDDSTRLPSFDEAVKNCADHYGVFYEQHKLHPGVRDILESVHTSDHKRTMDRVYNIFERSTASSFPKIADAISTLRKTDALAAGTVGHSTMIFGIFDNRRDAENAMQNDSFKDYRVIFSELC